jgi:putative hydrolase of the HAD superfamily
MASSALGRKISLVKRAIVFDGDDTLWRTEWLYDVARQRARQVVEAAGLDGAAWEKLERRIDVANAEQLGHQIERFPKSCLDAYEVLCETSGHPIDNAVRERVRAGAQAVFAHQAPLVAGARETLTALRNRGYRLALLTKGDPDVQLRRVRHSGLEQLFDVVEIVDEKTPEAITSVLDRLGVDPGEALSVGNSIRSDVLPALAAGVQAIWIDAHVWEYERLHRELSDADVIEVEDLEALLEALAQ